MWAQIAIGLIALAKEIIQYAQSIKKTAKQLDEWTADDETAWTKSLADLSVQDHWKPEDK